jgi:hypothetical protein
LALNAFLSLPLRDICGPIDDGRIIDDRQRAFLRAAHYALRIQAYAACVETLRWFADA